MAVRIDPVLQKTRLGPVSLDLMPDVILKLGELVEDLDWEYTKAIVEELTTLIISRTPIDTGRARNHWEVSLNAPSQRSPDMTNGPFADLPKLSLKELRKTKRMAPVFLDNTVPYIENLEQGSSRQAPPGYMIEMSVAEVIDKYGYGGEGGRTVSLDELMENEGEIYRTRDGDYL